MPEILTAALEIAESGRRIFPLKPDSKVPAIRSWPEKASTDPDMIRWWWRTQPRANIGLPTGARLVVLDIDTKHGANPDLWGDNATLQARTPTGGVHIYYAVDIEIPNSVGRLARGVDVRGERGYVVAPPSRLPNGDYRWLNGLEPVHLSDDEARELIPEDIRNPSTNLRRSFRYRDEVPVGQRNDYLTRLAGYLMAQGDDDTDVDGFLREEANSLKFTPRPDEIRKIVKSVRRYH